MSFSLYAPAVRETALVPVVRAYYDRQNMEQNTPDVTDHAHALCELMYVAEGMLRLVVGAEGLQLGRRQYILIDAGTPHQLHFLPGMSSYALNIEFALHTSNGGCPATDALYRQDAAFADMLDHPTPYVSLTDTDDTVYRLLKRVIALAGSDGAFAAGMCAQLAAQLLLCIARQRTQVTGRAAETAPNPHVARALAYMQQHYAQPITAQQLADMLSIRPSHLHRLFKKHTGMTVHQHLQAIRIENARRLLHTRNESILEIAAMVGFGSQQHFAHLFSRIVGHTPAEFRRRARSAPHAAVRQNPHAPGKWDDGDG